MASMDKLMASRAKSIAKLEAEVAEYRKTYGAIPVGDSARLALDAVISVAEQRLARLRGEYEAFRRLASAPDPRQGELGAGAKPRK